MARPASRTSSRLRGSTSAATTTTTSVRLRPTTSTTSTATATERATSTAASRRITTRSAVMNRHTTGRTVPTTSASTSTPSSSAAAGTATPIAPSHYLQTARSLRAMKGPGFTTSPNQHSSSVPSINTNVPHIHTDVSITAETPSSSRSLMTTTPSYLGVNSTPSAAPIQPTSSSSSTSASSTSAASFQNSPLLASPLDSLGMPLDETSSLSSAFQYPSHLHPSQQQHHQHHHHHQFLPPSLSHHHQHPYPRNNLYNPNHMHHQTQFHIAQHPPTQQTQQHVSNQMQGSHPSPMIPPQEDGILVRKANGEIDMKVIPSVLNLDDDLQEITGVALSMRKANTLDELREVLSQYVQRATKEDWMYSYT